MLISFKKKNYNSNYELVNYDPCVIVNGLPCATIQTT